MSNIEITLEGSGIRDTFHNDWDQCEARGLLHIEDLEGWLGGVGASVTPDLNRFRRHGKFPGRTIRSARKMDLTLTWHRSISGEDDYTFAARVASGIAWDEGPYLMTVNEDGFILSTEVQLDGEPSFQPVVPGSKQAFRMRVPLRANDPFLYGPKEEVVVSPSGVTPVVAPEPFGPLQNAAGEQVLVWTAAAARAPHFNNTGTADAYPVWTIVGNSPAGVEVNVDGKIVQYAAPIFEQAPLVIDYKKGSATMNGRDVSFNLRKREWTSVAPHTTARPRMHFLSNGGTGYALAYIRPTWI